MQPRMAGLALGVLLSCSAAPAAYADQSIDTAAFTITYLEGLFSTTGDISLVGAEPGAYRFSLDTLNSDLFQLEAQDATGAGATNNTAHASILRIEAHTGYRVTNVSLTYSTFGELTPGQVPGFPPGFVSNAAGIFMGVWHPGGIYSFGNQYADFVAQENWEFDRHSMDLAAVTDVSFNAWLWAQAVGVDGGGEVAASFASAAFRDAVLRVEVAPVPEPATYAMLLAGLGAVGAACRRRR